MAQTATKLLLLLSAIMISSGAWAADQRVEFNRTGDSIEILIAGKPFGTYQFDSKIAKPFLAPLRSAQGTIITRGFPMVALPGEPTDEPHQRGMFFGHGMVNGNDFWGEAATST